MSSNYDDLQQSYGRCLREKNFIARFYEIFLDSHPAIAPMFAATDFQKQRMALRRGISAAISHAGGSSLSKRTVDRMADVHSRTGHAPVLPELYPYWVDSLVQAVGEVDPEATPQLLERWREGMSVVTDAFIRRY
ncbi:globin [Thiobacillus sedimenti]|uniref:Globin n=1 Tax=Thiobacillus sedimenti TaxID=3110231 RepID=A0ABZ1CLE2_9PROT|nr:globin [Thiobacillus sp. SCUT-2]WRS40087.1 globin [Thiobacillus sp. SCUT-2]